MDNNFTETKEKMQKRIDALEGEFSTLRAGRANPKILDKIYVDYYGVSTAIPQMAAVSVVEARNILITPWDMTALKDIEKAIQASDLGINPQNDGKAIRLNFPPLTEERRKELVKLVHQYSENCKIAIRNVRRDSNDALKKMEKAKEITEDELKTSEKKVQDLTDKFIKEIEELESAKTDEVMSV